MSAAAAQDPPGAAPRCECTDALDGCFDARRAEQVEAHGQETLAVDVRVRVGQSRQHELAAAVHAVGVGEVFQQGLVAGGDDLAVGVEDEHAEFAYTVIGGRVADHVVDGGIRGGGDGPERGEGNQEAGGCDHERAPESWLKYVAKIPQIDAMQPVFT
jgi:hypothetical protein